jgi:hypothetical protein
MRCCRGGWTCQRQVQRCEPRAGAHCRLRRGHPALQPMLPSAQAVIVPPGFQHAGLPSCTSTCLMCGSPACPAPLTLS